MTPWTLLGLALVLTLVALLYAHEQGRVRIRRRVLVNLDTGRTFSGVLWCKTGDWLVLRNAEMIARGEAGVPVEGEVVIERGRVEFVQAF